MEDLLMIYYKDEQCPVCLKKFKEEDEIVVCPECGTPYHRECYEKLGHCIYESKHGEYCYTNSRIENINQVVNQRQENKEQDEISCSYCNELNDRNDKVCKKCGLPLKVELENPFSDKLNLKSEDKVLGIKIKYWAAYLGINATSHIIKFKSTENKKYSLAEFNFGAFIFSEWYFIYRKMYLSGALFFILRMVMMSFGILLLLPDNLLNAIMNINYVDFWKTMFNINENPYCRMIINNIVLFLNQNLQLNKYRLFINFVIAILSGSIATRIYKRISIKKIKSLDKKDYENDIAYRDALTKKGSVSCMAVSIVIFVRFMLLMGSIL